MGGVAEADLERRAEEMAQKALPSSLPAAARAAKLPAVKQKILERLLSQARAPPAPEAPAAAPSAASRPAFYVAASAAAPSTGPPPPTPDERMRQLKVEGAELYGDEPWFADADVRARLRTSVAEAHREQKILVGSPAEEIARICRPGLGAGAILRLGGAHLGGYGEPDIAYAYRQLSRVLHPDKNPTLPTAPAAFHRLSEAAEELRQGLTEQRQALEVFALAFGQTSVSSEASQRPQEALFAEACKLLAAVCGLLGEGDVPGKASGRSLAAFAASPAYPSCQAQQLTAEWLKSRRLLELLGLPPVRAAYDSAPKRYRAQFLCLLARTLAAEQERAEVGVGVREGWAAIAKAFPELSLWHHLRACIGRRVVNSSHDSAPRNATRSRSRSRSRSREDLSEWGRKWRTAIMAVLPAGRESAVPATDAEVRKLAYVLWRDLVKWVVDSARDIQAERALGLFRADNEHAKAPLRGLAPDRKPVEWAFVPISDLLLVVGHGRVGITFEGIFADNPSGHKRLSLAECYKKKPSSSSG